MFNWKLFLAYTVIYFSCWTLFYFIFDINSVLSSLAAVVIAMPSSIMIAAHFDWR